MLYDGIKKWAEIKGNASAICHGKRSISYKQINEQSDSVASYLNKKGISEGARVGVMLEKCIESVVAIYGILKAGASYVPIDANGPEARSEFIINDCQMSAIFVDYIGLSIINSRYSTLPKNWIVILCCRNECNFQMSSKWIINTFEEIINYTGDTNENRITDNSLAYILYTSGSTGTPKGVMLTHRNGDVFVDWAVDTLCTRDDDIFSSHAPFTFDLSVFDIFAAHKAGGTLVLPPAGIAYFPKDLLKYIKENKITIWYSVPSALIQLLKCNNVVLSDQLSSLRIIIYAGEVFPVSHLKELLKYLNNCRVFNFYGPTETNVITYCEIDQSNMVEDVPIGRACPYANIHIINKVDSVGELIVNGESLMMGYWNDKDKTENSIKIIILEGKEELFYHTGDFVRIDNKNQLVYVNRNDHMVKTRGFRVELGEIEKNMLRIKGIRSAVVIAKPDKNIGNRLIAFVEVDDFIDQIIMKVKEALADIVPVYMIPEEINVVDKIPISSNGKIDRKKLQYTT